MSALVVVPTGTANTASVIAAFRRLGTAPTPAKGAEDILAASHVVLPGVGSFGVATGELNRKGLLVALAERVRAGRPTIAICVGMQLLAKSSEESPLSTGLAVLADRATRFGDGVRVPQLGWNQVIPGPGSRYVTEGWAYFANSYRLTRPPSGWACAYTDYGGPFVSAIERGDVLACQFHPELSGEWGAGLLDRWLATTGRSS